MSKDKNIIKQDGKTYRQDVFGNWVADKDFFGNEKVDRDSFGNPEIEHDFFGNQKIEQNWLGQPKIDTEKSKNSSIKGTYNTGGSSSGESLSLGDAASAALVLSVAGALGLTLVILGFQYLSFFGWFVLAIMLTAIIILLCNKRLAGDFKLDCILTLILCMVLILINAYVNGMLAEYPARSTARASNIIWFVFFGGSFLTLGSTIGLASIEVKSAWLWFVTLAWTTIVSLGHALTMNDGSANWWAFLAVAAYAAKLFIEFMNGKVSL